jgi:Gram-negative bacterial TonB protein C-terminal
VEPIYPREAPLAHTEGVVKLNLVIGKDNSTAELQAVSGDPVLVDSSMKAVRQWCILHFGGRVAGQPAQEIEVPLSFTFRIENAPKPALSRERLQSPARLSSSPCAQPRAQHCPALP